MCEMSNFVLKEHVLYCVFANVSGCVYVCPHGPKAINPSSFVQVTYRVRYLWRFKEGASGTSLCQQTSIIRLPELYNDI